MKKMRRVKKNSMCLEGCLEEFNIREKRRRKMNRRVKNTRRRRKPLRNCRSSITILIKESGVCSILW